MKNLPLNATVMFGGSLRFECVFHELAGVNVKVQSRIGHINLAQTHGVFFRLFVFTFEFKFQINTFVALQMKAISY